MRDRSAWLVAERYDHPHRRADALLPALRSAVSAGRGVATSADEASAAADASEEPAEDEATA